MLKCARRKLDFRLRHLQSLASISHIPILTSDEVSYALTVGLPIVALESTIISHGMPYPENLEVALKVEEIVRKEGCIPATIAIVDGIPSVGLTSQQLHIFAKAGSNARKCSRRDIALAMAQKAHGATTVAATMVLANIAGIHVFVTGGIGGVHHGFNDTMDISADIVELGRTPVSVICAGVKSILDIPRTLEALETNGVPVVAFKTDEFPSFFSPNSGIRAPARVDSAAEVAAAISASLSLGMKNGMLIAVPNEFDGGDCIDAAIKDALIEARKRDIRGREVTPFLLSRVNDLTKGVSLESNISLIQNNAAVGAQIASALSKLQTTETRPTVNIGSTKKYFKRAIIPRNEATIPESKDKTSNSGLSIGDITVIGGCLVDYIAQAGPSISKHSSVPGKMQMGFGGVARNISEALGRLREGYAGGKGGIIRLVSAVGDDNIGEALVSHMIDSGVDTTGIKVLPDNRTASYVAILDNRGDLHAGIADTELLDHALAFAGLATLPLYDEGKGSVHRNHVVVDGNMPSSAFYQVVQYCARLLLPMIFEPTSVVKSTMPILSNALHHVSLVTPNVDELVAMAECLINSSGKNGEILLLKDHEKLSISNFDIDALHPLISVILQSMHGTYLNSKEEHPLDLQKHTFFDEEKHVVVTLGAQGVLTGSSNRRNQGCIKFQHFPAFPASLVDCTGAGDCFVAGLSHGLALGSDLENSVHLGMLCARRSVESSKAVPNDLGQVLSDWSPS